MLKSARRGETDLYRVAFMPWLIVATGALLLGLGAYFENAYVPVIDALVKAKGVGLSVFISHWWDVIFALLKALPLLILFLSAGTRLLFWLCPSGIECIPGSAVIRTLVGAMLLAMLVLGCGLCGILYPYAVLGMFLALSIRDIRSIRFTGVRLGTAPLAKMEYVYLFFILLALAVLVPFALGPMVTPDVLHHSYAATLHYVNLHKITYCYRYHFLLPNFLEFVYSATLSVTTINAIIVVSAVSTLVLVYCWAHDKFGRPGGLLSVCGVLISMQYVICVSHLKDDVPALLYALASFVLWEHALERRNMQRVYWLSGLIMGCAFCVKYPTAAISAGMVAWSVWRGRSRSLVPLVMAAGGFGAIVAFVAAKSWLLTGNPVFPFFWGGFGWEHSSVEETIGGAAGSDFTLKEPVAMLGVMMQILTEQAPLFWICVPMAIYVCCVGDGKLVPPLAAALGGIVALSVLAPTTRFMVAPAVLLSIAGAIVVYRGAAFGRLKGVIFHVCTIMVLASGLLRVVAAADLRGKHNTSRLAAGLGLEDRDDCRQRLLTYLLTAAQRTAKMNIDRTLLVGEARNALFAEHFVTISQYVSDYPIVLKSVRESSTPERIAIKLRQLGLSSLILNYVGSEWQGAASAGRYWWSIDELRRYREYVMHWCEWVPLHSGYDYPNGGFMLFRLGRWRASGMEVVPFLPGTEAQAALLFNEEKEDRRRRLERCVAALPGVAHFETTYGCVLVEDGEYKKAVRYLRKGLESGFEDAGTYSCLGLALKALGQYREAARAFSRASELRPEELAFARLTSECERAAVQNAGEDHP